MVQQQVRTRMGPETFEVGESIVGGSLVKFGAGGKVVKTTAITDEWVGVTLYDAEPSTTTGEDTVFGFPRVDAGVPRPDVAVAWHGVIKLKITGGANPGALVYPSTTAGTVATTATGAVRAVGQVVQTTAVSAGAYGLVRLF